MKVKKLGVLLVFFVGCYGGATPSEKVARLFMDHYYVEASLEKAAQDSDSIAQDKVKKGIQLTDGKPFDRSANHPDVSYKLLESHVEGEEADYFFELVIKPPKSDTIRKKALLKIRRRENGLWKVSQFTDYDQENKLP